MRKKAIKQSTLNFLLGGLSITLSIVLVVLSIQVGLAFGTTRQAEARRAELRQLGFDLQNASTYLTDEMREYVQFGDQVHADNYWTEVNDTRTREQVLEKLETLGVTAEELSMAGAAKQASDELIAFEERAIAAVEAGNFDAARQIMFGSAYDSSREQVIAALSIFQKAIDTRAAETLAQATLRTDIFIVLMVVMVILQAVFAVISLLLSHFKIIRPLVQVKGLMAKVAEGDFSASISLAEDDTEIGQLVHSVKGACSTMKGTFAEISAVLEQMSKGNLAVDVTGVYPGDFAPIKTALLHIIDALNGIFTSVHNAADQVAASATQVADSSMMLSQGATEQASAMEELNASFDEVSTQTSHSASYAEQANILADLAKKGANQGNVHMDEMLEAMTAIGVSSEDISRIIKVIDDIAFQTNILALNAAVEAARAGQHGKGFAVVADEVRILAARSAQAAKETTDMIQNSIDKVTDGTRIANETANALREIVDTVDQVALLISDIAQTSGEQAENITQITQGMTQVTQVIQTNAATSEEEAASSEELSGQAALLKAQVGHYQLKQ